ncbi:uncharacterized protein MYCFIDRAFT_84598 [Pseudocercospora fijiensis CIRAD86]|uniref:Uncharacterized protein n=1 Tax=Pseudocercospora fijiensis (strain CIRAD86) TaxID=383855 RepID=M3APC7_PSEFD|nr:uncharacterized protein MYCFIDRAFT_84598 [Pseudocercospora fijiensis CIRAD86]EME86466.1 hypothetical protein MYCFIDRAFT_84598 [Pseudocercospora fijiensis CIRAD86]
MYGQDAKSAQYALRLAESQPMMVELAGTAFHNRSSTDPALMRELATAKQAFEEQEETIRHLDQEASDHETIIWQQQQQISRLTKVPYTAAQDYAEVLGHANGKLHGELAALKDRNSMLETELSMARMLSQLRTMDLSTLLNNEAATLAQYLRNTASQHGADEVTRLILTGIEEESIPPRVFTLWLTAGGDCQAVRAGLRQQVSKSVTHGAIARLGKLFRSQRVEEVWNVLGGTSGVVDYLASTSVANVKHFCREIGRTATSKAARETRQSLVDELYKELKNRQFPNAVLKTLERPLAAHHRSLLPACSEETVLSTLSASSKPVSDGLGKLPGTHISSIRRRTLSALRNEGIEIDKTALQALLMIKSDESLLYRGERLSENTVFSLEVLRVLSDRTFTKVSEAESILSFLARPLFQRLWRCRCKPGILIAAAECYVKYFTTHLKPSARHLELDNNSVATTIIRRWSRHPETFEDHLVELLGLASPQQKINPRQIQALVALVHSSMKYRLFRIVMSVAACFKVDIESEDDLKSLDFAWSSDLLLALPGLETRHLLQRLIKVKAGDVFQAGFANYDKRFSHDSTLVLLWLSKDQPDLLSSASEVVEESKKEASKARQQEERARWASYALHCATASCSLDLYRETLLWAKTYTRNPITVTDIYSESSIHRERSLNLLCGFAEKAEAAANTPQEVSESVRKANRICEELLQTACEALTEPSFQPYHWTAVTQVMDLVVQRRLERVNDLQDSLVLSDEQVFEIIWQDTVAVCLRMERLGLDEKHANLGFNTAGGPILSIPEFSSHTRHVLVKPRPATLRFIDIIARQRDQLWADYRPTQYPAASALPALYPKGLSIGYLIPAEIGKDGLGYSDTAVPYLRARAEQIVFVRPEDVLSVQLDSDETEQAIGPFQEDWKKALQVFVASSSDHSSAAMAAWKYAVGPLSAPRLNPVEAFLFWSPIFRTSLLALELYGPWKERLSQPPISALFTIEPDALQTEWNPDPKYLEHEVKSRKLERTRLDDMLQKTSHYIDDIKCGPCHYDAYIPAYKPTLIWNRFEGKAMPVTMKETLIVAVMLYIAGQHKPSASLLPRPYPSDSAPRFPAVYLDGEFLDLNELHTKSIWRILERLSSDVPYKLLLELIRGIIAAADLQEERTPVDAFKLMMVLVKGDRPQIGLELIKEIVLERPMDSSWQRSLVTNGLLNALPRDVAEAFLCDLAEGMQQKMRDQSTRKQEASSSQTPLIKVTTIKMLSQLFSGAEFIDEESAVRILISLLRRASHLDVRVSVIDSLSDILASAQSSKLRAEVIDALEEHVVPAMSSINERKPMNAYDWKRAETDLSELSDVYMENDATAMPPMLATVFSALKIVDLRDEIFSRLVIPTLHGSIQILALREVEVWLQAWNQIYSPAPRMLEVTKRVQEDSKLRESNAGKHWLSMFGPNASRLIYSKTLVPLLKYEWTARHDGPSIQQLQNVLMRQAETILRSSDSSFGDWTEFVRSLHAPIWPSSAFAIWYKNVRPVLQELVTQVEALRTQQWQCNRDRSPRMLPGTLFMRLPLTLPPDTGHHEGDLTQLHSGLMTLLQELCSSQRVYGDRYNQFFKFLRGIGFNSDDMVTMAIRFGTLDASDLATVQNWNILNDLRIDLGKQILQNASVPTSSEIRRQAVGMVRSWSQSLDEDTRMVGIRLLETKAVRAGKKPWYVSVED